MMRAKMTIVDLVKTENGQQLTMQAISKSAAYPDDGSDEDNSFAMFTPSASVEMQINNPALSGKFHVNQVFYVDFTEVPPG